MWLLFFHKYLLKVHPNPKAPVHFWFEKQGLQAHSRSLCGAVAPIVRLLPCAQGFQRCQSRFSRRRGDDSKVSLRGAGVHRPQPFHGPGRNLPGVRSQNGRANEVYSSWGRTRLADHYGPAHQPGRERQGGTIIA